MTGASGLERLAASVLVPGFDSPGPTGGEVLPGWVRRALDDGLPGVCLYGANATSPGSLGRLGAQVLTGWPHALVAADEEGGDVTRLEYLTGSSYPGNLALGVVDDEALTAQVGRAIAADLRAASITVDLAPSVDVGADPRNPVIGVRSFDPDPDLVSRHGAAMVRGLQDGGVAAVAKHFPGHGATSVDSHLELPVIDADPATFRARELPPFAAAVAAGVLAVMTGHVVFARLDDQPATLSRRLLVDLLRGELGFTGAVVTDALDMAGVRARHGMGGGAVRALAAGSDLLLLGTDGEGSYVEARAALVAAVSAGDLPLARLEEAAARTGAMQRAVAALPAPAAVDRGVGLRAARAAVRASGVPLSAAERAGGVLVAEVRGGTNLAVGQARWGLVEPLRELAGSAGGDGGSVWGPVEGVVVGEGTAVDGVLTAARGRALVLAVRDAHRSPWQRAVVEAVLRARQDAVLVALGMPDDADLATAAAGPGARWVLARSASRVSAAAAAEAVLGT